MKLKFTKMHGLGNDFVVIDAVSQPVALDTATIRRLADRHFGVGCDQVLVVEPPPGPEADFRYRIFNADGSEVAQCGNGARCFARFVREKGLIDRDVIRVVTAAGAMTLTLVGEDRVRVNMGVPNFDPAAIPLAVHEEMPEYQVSVAGHDVIFGAVSLGNPHAVIVVPSVEKAPVAAVGAALQQHPLFPERVNVGFMEIVSPGKVRLRVYERGSGETLACGSGACAAAVVGIDQGRLRSPVTVALPGGELTVEWQGRGEPVWMTGPAESVFEGEIEL
ncbi:diaminopimelate epimerase [Methylomarinovum caldicuralii]|uniref:Diaminopimelate epimerase n=2 Tax=Methylomarinovum caldicuralii TaxID=438856 RepID=A0AAU9C2I4_9GAMM|nr:diaminopimelate epimerase [Methylomarinovum caldicuralii]